MNRHFTKDLQMGNGYIKWGSTSFLTREYKLKPQYANTIPPPVRLTQKRTDNSKYWQG